MGDGTYVVLETRNSQFAGHYAAADLVILLYDTNLETGFLQVACRDQAIVAAAGNHNIELLTHFSSPPSASCNARDDACRLQQEATPCD
ncbi:hypothetical protein SDC9_205616 [bioreactor metagenome]|uniref:Uncharacterized protein n=1 Tax=bioreactor metagenome TaxID=1076179 RepID=A0A645J466_9ZZZZ